VRQAEMSVKEIEEWGTGHGIQKWERCFDCGQRFHGPVQLALGWACWKTYLGRSDRDQRYTQSMGILGGALRLNDQPEEALPVLEANLALKRRYWSHNEQSILMAQSDLASCLANLGQHDEALVLKRATYSRRVATLGVSHERTILSGANLSISLQTLGLWDELKTFTRDRLLPEARRSLGADHDLTLRTSHNLAVALMGNPESTRNNPRLNQRGESRRDAFLISTQGSTCSKPKSSCRTWSRGGGGPSVTRIRTRFTPRAFCPRCAQNSPARPSCSARILPIRDGRCVRRGLAPKAGERTQGAVVPRGARRESERQACRSR